MLLAAVLCIVLVSGTESKDTNGLSWSVMDREKNDSWKKITIFQNSYDTVPSNNEAKSDSYTEARFSGCKQTAASVNDRSWLYSTGIVEIL